LGFCERGDEFSVLIKFRIFFWLAGKLLVYREGLLQGDDHDDDDNDVVSVPNFIQFDTGQIPKILCRKNWNERFKHGDILQYLRIQYGNFEFFLNFYLF